MGSKRRLLLGITLSELGGAQRVVYQLIEHLPKELYDITVFCAPGGELLAWIEELNRSGGYNISVVTCDALTREINPVKDIKAFFCLYRLMKRERFDIVHFHSSKMGILGRVAATLVGSTHTIFTVHGWGINDTQSPLKRSVLGLVERVVGKLGHTVVCVCQHDLDRGLRAGYVRHGQGCVIYNGAAPVLHKPRELRKGLLGLSDSTFLIGMLGRLVEAKHPELAIEVARELRIKTTRPFHLVLIGDGPLMSVCQQLIKEYQLEGFVTLLGAHPTPQEIIGDLDVLLMPSRYEGFPLAALEAFAQGVPVVSTPVGGLPEVVAPGKNGFLVKPASDEIGQVLIDMIEQSTLSATLRQGATETAARFTIAAMVQAYRELYESKERRGKVD